MDLRRGRSSIATAFIAACVLVLQSVLGALAYSSDAGPVQLDAFGNVICTHDGAGTLPAGDPHRQSMPPCCTMGCIAASMVFSPPPAAFALSRTVSFEAVAFVFPADLAPLVSRGRSPANPRAPPLLA